MGSAGMRSAVVSAALIVCSSCGSGAAPQGGSPDAAAVQVNSLTCNGDPTACLLGTAQLASGFVSPPTRPLARLFRGFPSATRGSSLDGGAVPQQIVAIDHTWAFSGLDAWAHYYVQFEPGFSIDAGVLPSPATRIGPLVVPATGAAIDVQVKPAQLDVFEVSSPGMAGTVETASARLSEATPGSSSVSIRIGTTETKMTYDSTTHSYSVTFSTPPAAQPTYQITRAPLSGSPTQWNLVADPPTFTGAITSPAPGATVPVGKSIDVTWVLQPADYVIVDLFVRMNKSWVNVYTSSTPDAPDVSSETIPAVLADGGTVTAAGSYLLNVSFAKANCPATADGCVHSSTVASEQLTVQ
jgi:hypothetical protein